MSLRLVQLVLLTEMKKEFSRLLERPPHTDKVTYKGSLTTEHDTLRQCFVYPVNRLLLLFFFVIEQSVNLFHKSREKLVGCRFLLLDSLQAFFFELVDRITELLINHSLKTSLPRVCVVPSSMFVYFRAQNYFSIPVKVKNHLSDLKDGMKFLQTCLFFFEYDVEKCSQK